MKIFDILNMSGVIILWAITNYLVIDIIIRLYN